MTDGARAYAGLIEGAGLSVRHALGDTAWCFGKRAPRAVGVSEREGAVRVLDAQGVLWTFDASTGAVLARAPRPGRYATHDAVFDRTGARLAVLVSYGQVDVVALDSGATVQCSRDVRIDGEPAPRFAWDVWLAGFSRDGETVLGEVLDPGYGRQRGAVLWDARTGEVALVRRTFARPAWNAGGDALFLCAEEPSGATSVTCVTARGAARWSTAVPVRGPLALTVSGDGATVLVSGELRAGPRRSVRAPDAPPARYGLVALHAIDGSLRWSREGDRREGLTPVPASSVLLTPDPRAAYDAATGALVNEEPEAHRVLVRGHGPRALAWSPAWRAAFTAQGGRVRRLDAGPWREARAEGLVLGELTRASVSPSGARAVTANRARDVRCWKTATGTVEWALEGLSRKREVDAVAVTADERFALAVSGDRAMGWSLAHGLSAFSVPFNATMAQVREGVGVGLSAVHTALLAGDARSLLLVGRADRAIRTTELLCYDTSEQRVRWRAKLPREYGAISTALAAGGTEVWLASNFYAHAVLSRYALADGDGGVAPAPLRRRMGVALESVPYGRAGAWVGIDWSAGVSVGPDPVLLADALERAGAAGPVAHDGTGRWVLTGSKSGDALLWRARPGDPVAAACVARVRLSAVFDAASCAAFDARGETLLLGTERGALLFCSLTA